MSSSKNNKISVITLGYYKNTVDSKVLIHQLRTSGLETVHNPEKVEGGTVIINTCGFIRDAQEESVDMILRFARLGIFTYSHEEGTYAYIHYRDDIPERVKHERADKIMEIQEEISGEMNMHKIGKTYTVVTDRKEGAFWVGRTEFDSPEVDQEILMPDQPAREIKPGQFFHVRITRAEDFDLFGEITGEITI